MFLRKQLIKFILLHLYYSFLVWQVIENKVIKHPRTYRYALTLWMQYIDSKYLTID